MNSCNRLIILLHWWQAADEDLKNNCNEWTCGTARIALRIGACWSSTVGPPVRQNGKTWWEEWDVGCVITTHCNVDGWKLDGGIDNQWAWLVRAALLEYKHVVWAGTEGLFHYYIKQEAAWRKTNNPWKREKDDTEEVWKRNISTVCKLCSPMYKWNLLSLIII